MLRSTDNRDLSEMERLYAAQIEALKRELAESKQTIQGLRDDLFVALHPTARQVSR